MVCTMNTFRRVSLPGALLSSLGIASLSPLTSSGGVRCLDLKKFMAPLDDSYCESETSEMVAG